MNATRFSKSHVDVWKKEGFVLIPNFFSADEIAPIVADYEALYGVGHFANELNAKEEGSLGAFREDQFKNIDTLPYNGSTQMNLLSLHPGLIELSRQLLDCQDIHLYQSHTWAKFTGEADYDQVLHCDFGNHTLTVPADKAQHRTVDIIIYLTDVTDEHGALHYVPKPVSDRILGEGAIWTETEDEQLSLREHELSGAAPAGSILAHSIDTFHRGTNLTKPGGYRYTMTVGYKSAGNDMIGFHVWQTSRERNWTDILANATVEQLACLGIPRPGHEFWTRRTLSLTSRRWPDWDMQAYRDAVG